MIPINSYCARTGGLHRPLPEDQVKNTELSAQTCRVEGFIYKLQICSQCGCAFVTKGGPVPKEEEEEDKDV